MLRVDDTPHPFKLEGKQGYGKARGIWQTIYLEARPAVYVESFELRPDVGLKRVEALVRLSDPAPAGRHDRAEGRRRPRRTRPSPRRVRSDARGCAARRASTLPLGESPRLWSLEDPFLYDAVLTLTAGGATDRVKTYFGMRSIGVTRLPGLGYPYVALNGKPVYLQMTLDQGWHPDGFYTWPSDAAMREEILIARRLGLNAIRTHVKVELPRKLYWADRLGVLVMSDVPNSWGEPDAAMRQEWETAFRGMVRRDFNHPSIFSWVLFNEQWGLLSTDPAAPDRKTVLPETLDWVASRYDLAKQLDPTRLVEDNSPCCGGGHVRTDLNSWHMYLPGWGWRELLDEAEAKTFPGSSWNYVGGRTQGGEPMLNSECGNVWGYEGSTGDVDWSFDYHAMMNELRRHPKVAGWLYTEHHDVVNEWNGYVRADRSPKETGLGELVPGMTLRDLHAPLYVAAGSFPTTAARPGETVSVPLWASFLTDVSPGAELTLRMTLVGHDDLGREREWWRGERKLPFEPWLSRALEPLVLDDARAPRARRPAPGARGLRRARAAPQLHGLRGRRRPRAAGGVAARRRPGAARAARRAGCRERGPLDAARLERHLRQEAERRRVPATSSTGCRGRRTSRAADVASASFLAELGAKRLFGKDRLDKGEVEGDFMRGAGTHDPGLNPNAYPMTDTSRHPSAVRVVVNGVSAGVFDLANDPADHRGLLSWHAQQRSAPARLSEAGSYGELVSASLPAGALEAAARSGRDRAAPGGRRFAARRPRRLRRVERPLSARSDASC